LVYFVDIKTTGAPRRAPRFAALAVIIVNFIDDGIFQPLSGL